MALNLESRIDIHCHTRFSNLRLVDALPSPEDLIDYAIEIGLNGITISDHESLSGHIKANKYAQEIRKTNPDFKVILGNEIYLVDERPSNEHYHFILVAKDEIGHKQLRILSSLAWLNSYSARGLERVDTLKSEVEKIVKKNPGHLIASSACIGGELGKNILALTEAEKHQMLSEAEEAHNKIVNFILWCKKIFGEDFYLEVQPGVSKEQIIVNQRILSIAHCFELKIIPTSDAHFLRKEDRYVHKAFLNSKQGEREVDSFYQDAYLHTNEEMIQKFKFSNFDEIFVKQMFRNTMEIYSKITNYSLFCPQKIPNIEVINYDRLTWWKESEIYTKLMSKYPVLMSMFDSKDKIERYWINQCWESLEKKKGHWYDNLNYVARLEEEATTKRIIGQKLNTNIFAYPVVLQHYIDMFWECGSMVGAGRGSSCSGLNHYLLGVTQLDPIEWNFPWFRYLNESREELPDIDIDICPSKRPMILSKIKKERGQNFNNELEDVFKENLGCTLVATFGTETSKSAVATACRGYRTEEYPEGIDVDTAQYLSKLIPQERGFVWSIKETVYGNKEKDRKPVIPFINEMEKYPGLLDIILGIEGLISRRGSHASGVILFDEDPFEHCCFMKTPSGEIITQWDLHDAEWAGSTKYDMLVTEVEDKLTKCLELLQEYGEIEKDLTLRELYNKYLHPEILPIKDEKTWKVIQQAASLDLFQLDSDIGRQGAKKVKPSNMLELSAVNGLIRLMTQEKGAETPMEKYIRFKNNPKLWEKEMNSYGLNAEQKAAFRRHTTDTYGIGISQEQLMRSLMDKDICNFTLSESNGARKTVAKKQMNKIKDLKDLIWSKASDPAVALYEWDSIVAPGLG